MTETASFPPVQAPLADPARTVFFGIPLRARATAIDWSKTCRDFSRTLASIYNQSNPNFRIIVCCHDIPDLLIPTDQRLEFIKVHTPAPDLRADPKSIFPDKSRKMRKAIERFHALGGGWLMILDADDLVSSRLVEFVSRSDNENGFLVREGYLLDQDSRACARIPNEHVFDHPFDQICGSCAVL
ncbi:MAG TPA: glycosyltransferase family A protein, partial [Alphaproteobacteria bacterium]|nr:glycosyltransferase family A protein [Alphaproteobacteria bacterium]